MGLWVYVDRSSHPFLPGADISGDWDGSFNFWISDGEWGVFASEYFCLPWDFDCPSYVSFCSCIEIVVGSRWGSSIFELPI